MSKRKIVERKQYLIGKASRLPHQTLSTEDVETLSYLLKNTVVDGTVDISALSSVFKSEVIPGFRFSEEFGQGEKKILVLDTSAGLAEQLKNTYKGHITVEENTPLDLLQGKGFESTFAPVMNSVISSFEEPLIVNITVRKIQETQTVLPGAVVILFGQFWLAKGITDENGRVRLTLYGETSETIKGLLVKPRDNYWSRWFDSPDISPTSQNLVDLRPLNSEPSLSGFPQVEKELWGQKSMKLEQIKGEYKGQGIKIAIIDSGLDVNHKDLQAVEVKDGYDFTEDSSESWKEDTLGHGTHVAGTIFGRVDEFGVYGIAPEAECYIYKVFPGGKILHLLKSLDKCIANQVDIVNLSLGIKMNSELLQQKIEEAHNAGIACIAAAGNSEGKVLFPAAYNNLVLAVAAIGKKDSFPPESYHAKQIGQFDNNGNFFSARFTCFGSEVDVCAPGVAVVSSVPTSPDSYAAWDGTSMACPHVVGFAALILQARETLRNKTGSARIKALFDAIKASASPLDGIDNNFQGAGLPDANKAGLTDDVNGNGKPPHTSDLLEVQKCLAKSIEILEKMIS